MNNGRKRVLIFLTKIPYPVVDGSRAKTLDNVAKGLAKEFEIEFLIATPEAVKESQVRFLEENYGRVFVFSFGKWRFAFRALRYLLSSVPFQVGCFFDREADAWFKANLHEYDAVYVHLIRPGRYLEGLGEKDRARVFIDLNDAISLTYKRGRKFGSPFWRVLYRLEEERVRRYETLLLREFKNFSVISETDRRYLKENANGSSNGIRFECIPRGVNAEVFGYSPSFGRKIAFMGQLDYPPNHDAVDYFCERIWPPLKTKMPDVQFIVMGKGGNGLAKKYPDVSFRGFVDDPYKLIAECSALVAPVRFGAGVQTKSLEAMAVGVPVVTTAMGTEGILGAKDGENIFVVGEEPGEWVRVLSRLLEDTEFARKVGGQGKRLIAERHSVASVQEQFRRVFSQIASNGNGLNEVSETADGQQLRSFVAGTGT